MEERIVDYVRYSYGFRGVVFFTSAARDILVDANRSTGDKKNTSR